LRTFLPPLIDAGLGALECRYPRYTPRVVRWLELLARHFGLVPTGGSDYHGPWRDERRIGEVDVPADTLDRLRAAAR
jgi:3',5'-nucleoside bisphosphate phosphatase